MKTDNQQPASVDEAKGQGTLAPATGSASLCEALDDGQEVEMYKLTGKTKGYQVRIHGDCWHESDPYPTLDEAINQVSQKYSAWKNAAE